MSSFTDETKRSSTSGNHVNQASNDGCTPLWRASREGHVDTVKVLLAAKDINVNQADEDGRTPLNWASHNGHVDTVKCLLAAKDINVNKTDDEEIFCCNIKWCFSIFVCFIYINIFRS